MTSPGPTLWVIYRYIFSENMMNQRNVNKGDEYILRLRRNYLLLPKKNVCLSTFRLPTRVNCSVNLTFS